MNPDLPKLLALQVKDGRVAELVAQQRAVDAEMAVHDAARDRIKAEIAQATRTAEEIGRRRDEAAAKLEKQRVQHESRRQRLEQERNPRVAAQLMADVDLGRSILAQEESDWLRLAEDATTRAAGVAAAKRAAGRAAGGAAGGPGRTRRQARGDRRAARRSPRRARAVGGPARSLAPDALRSPPQFPPGGYPRGRPERRLHGVFYVDPQLANQYPQRRGCPD